MIKLVTGASGFIGSHLVDDLLAQGEPVRGLVRTPRAATALQDRGVEVVVGEMGSCQILVDALHDVDVVYHCAAAVGPGYSKREIYETNLTGVRNLLEALRRLSGSGDCGYIEAGPPSRATACAFSGLPAMWTSAGLGRNWHTAPACSIAKA